MWLKLVSLLSNISTYGYLLSVPYGVVSVFEAGRAFLETIRHRDGSVGGGGLFSADFGLFVLTLPWSAVFEIKLPRNLWPGGRTYDYKIANFLNDQNKGINFVLYVVFIVFNCLLLFAIGYFLAKLAKRIAQ